jgi:hypothetical protein
MQNQILAVSLILMKNNKAGGAFLAQTGIGFSSVGIVNRTWLVAEHKK